MVKPNYICIGVQKGGTTSLINYLNQNPMIYCLYDELHFFDQKSGNKLSKKDIINYENLFKTNKKIVGVKTPSYCYLFYAIDRIYNYNPDIKLILILRDPISRAYSHFNMFTQKGRFHQDSTKENILEYFKKIASNLKNLKDISRNGKYFIERGFYDEIIEYIYSKFPKENVYIGISEEIKKDKINSYNQLYEFLGAKKLYTIKDTDLHIREYKTPISKELAKFLYTIYKPHIEKLYKILGRRIESWEKYYETLK